MNASCNDSGKLVPYSAFVSSTPALPAFYWDVYSSEQRIKELCKELCKLADYADILRNSIESLDYATPEDIEKIHIELSSEIARIENLIRSLALTTLIWDVQHGYTTSSTEAMRDMFNDLTVHAITVKQLSELDDMTVAGLSDCGLNVRGLAVMSKWLTDKFDLSEEFKA